MTRFSIGETVKYVDEPDNDHDKWNDHDAGAPFGIEGEIVDLEEFGNGPPYVTRFGEVPVRYGINFLLSNGQKKYWVCFDHQLEPVENGLWI